MDASVSAVLVTRAEPGAAETARRLIDLGYAPVVAPLLSVAVNEDAQLDLAGVQAVLFSSAAGARAFAQIAHRADFPALCVGEATALAAREAGFTDVRAADGDAESLAALARAALDPRAGAVLWASGADISRDIAADLRAAGFDARRAIVYRAEMAEHLPEAAVHALRSEKLAAVLFHSARAAEAFARCAADAGLADRASRLAAICISPRVAAAAQALSWARIAAASEPSEDALLATLEKAVPAAGA